MSNGTTIMTQTLPTVVGMGVTSKAIDTTMGNRSRTRTTTRKRAAKRTSRAITYHGRTGHPVIHTTADGRKYIMVRAKGGGTKRLYNGSKYWGRNRRDIRKLSL